MVKPQKKSRKLTPPGRKRTFSERKLIIGEIAGKDHLKKLFLEVVPRLRDFEAFGKTNQRSLEFFFQTVEIRS
ncbi:MAG: hypothetical protein L7F78_11280 [Syntrophales bacterium LBB04]|nr:hypothetical protein [Syntrophales bacterium LBB04]